MAGLGNLHGFETSNCLFSFFPILPSGKNTNNYGKSPFLMGKSSKSTISMVIFNSHVCLPEGNISSWEVYQIVRNPYEPYGLAWLSHTFPRSVFRRAHEHEHHMGRARLVHQRDPGYPRRGRLQLPAPTRADMYINMDINII